MISAVVDLDEAAGTPPLEEGEELLPGYVVVDLLARGGRVDTYDAWSEERGCRVVVKQVRPDRIHEPHVQAALADEARLLLGCTHPHLVRAYALVTEPRASLVIETLPGATLDALIDDGPLPTSDLAVLGGQLGSALGYLHRRGWLHLDLKPENVVVHGGRAVILDLGLASPPGPTGRGWGTPGYLAPEQARGGVVTAATDVWGLGVTLAEGATGRLVLDPDAGPGARPDLEGLEPALERLLTGCLAPEPADRLSLDEALGTLAALA